MNYIHAFHKHSSVSCSVRGTPRGARERDKETSGLKEFAVQLGDRITEDREASVLCIAEGLRFWWGEGSQESGKLSLRALLV